MLKLLLKFLPQRKHFISLFPTSIYLHFSTLAINKMEQKMLHLQTESSSTAKYENASTFFYLDIHSGSILWTFFFFDFFLSGVMKRLGGKSFHAFRLIFYLVRLNKRAVERTCGRLETDIFSFFLPIRPCGLRISWNFTRKKNNKTAKRNIHHSKRLLQTMLVVPMLLLLLAVQEGARECDSSDGNNRRWDGNAVVESFFVN